MSVVLWHVSPKLTPAERVAKLKAEHGSDAKLAKALAEMTGQRTTYQMVIRWRQGRVGISAPYAEALAKLAGTKPEAFRPLAPAPQFRSMIRRVQRLENEVEQIQKGVGEMRAALEEQGITMRGSP